MPTRSPKERTNPWHDWRNDARELAIVVVGVLLALLAQEVVQDYGDSALIPPRLRASA